MSGRSRNRRRQAGQRTPRGCASGRCDGRGAHARSRRIWMRLPTMTTPIRMTPWTTVGEVGVRRRGRSGPSGSAARMKTATIGPTTPPRPPARLTPPSTTAATLSSVYGPGHRRADAGADGQRQAAQRREQAGEHVGGDLRPADGDAAPEGGQPVAADGVDRQARAASGGAGSRSTATIDEEHDGAPWGPTRCRASP